MHCSRPVCSWWEVYTCSVVRYRRLFHDDTHLFYILIPFWYHKFHICSTVLVFYGDIYSYSPFPSLFDILHCLIPIPWWWSFLLFDTMMISLPHSVFDILIPDSFLMILLMTTVFILTWYIRYHFDTFTCFLTFTLRIRFLIPDRPDDRPLFIHLPVWFHLLLTIIPTFPYIRYILHSILIRWYSIRHSFLFVWCRWYSMLIIRWSFHSSFTSPVIRCIHYTVFHILFIYCSRPFYDDFILIHLMIHYHSIRLYLFHLFAFHLFHSIFIHCYIYICLFYIPHLFIYIHVNVEASQSYIDSILIPTILCTTALGYLSAPFLGGFALQVRFCSCITTFALHRYRFLPLH